MVRARRLLAFTAAWAVAAAAAMALTAPAGGAGAALDPVAASSRLVAGGQAVIAPVAGRITAIGASRHADDRDAPASLATLVDRVTLVVLCVGAAVAAIALAAGGHDREAGRRVRGPPRSQLV